MNRINQQCYWCSALGNQCRVLEEPVCKCRACSFFETTADFMKRNKAFYEKIRKISARNNIDNNNTELQREEMKDGRYSAEHEVFPTAALFRSTRVARGKAVRNRPVICVDSGVIYPSARHAAVACGVSMSNLHKALSGKSKSCAGTGWRYADDEGYCFPAKFMP